jgi:hypothetical protein
MTGSVIKPVVIPTTPLRHDGQPTGPRSGLSATHRTLPLPTVPTPRTSAAVYGLATVDCRGRVANQTVLHALGWAPGTPLDIHETHGLLTIRTHPHGVFSITSQGHLRLPAPVRHHCGLAAGDRVLLAADPPDNRLIVHPPAALDDMLARCHARLLDGDLA